MKKISKNNTVISAVTLKEQNFFLLRNKNTQLSLVKRDDELSLSNLIEMEDVLQAGIKDESVDATTVEQFLDALDESTNDITQLDIFYQIKGLNQTEKILLPNKEITV